MIMGGVTEKARLQRHIRTSDRVNLAIPVLKRERYFCCIQYLHSWNSKPKPMDNFNEAEAYENNSDVQMRFGLDLIKQINLKNGHRVLDVGCGTGRLTEVLAGGVGSEGQVVAIDPNAERLAIAREKHSASNIQYLLTDAEHLPGEHYDFIFSNFVLQWIKNKEVIFQQAQRILKKGGYLALVGVAKNHMFLTQGVTSKAFQEDTLNSLHDVKAEEMDHFARVHDFESISIRSDEAYFDCKSLQGIIDFFKTHSPSKMYDESHFNMERMKEHFKDNFVFTIPLFIGIYKKK